MPRGPAEPEPQGGPPAGVPPAGVPPAGSLPARVPRRSPGHAGWRQLLLSSAQRVAIADLRFAAWFLWMTPLLAALSRLCDAVRMATTAASTSPASAASRNLRTAVFSDDLTALLRCRAFSFCLLRLIWDLIFATRKPRSGSGSPRWARADLAPAAAPPRSKAGRNTSAKKDIPTPGPRSNQPPRPAAHRAAHPAALTGGAPGSPHGRRIRQPTGGAAGEPLPMIVTTVTIITFPASSAAAAAGHDGADGHLQRITRVRALPLHLRVGLRDGGQCPGDPVWRPAAQLLAHLVDAPRRGAEFRGERGGGLGARRGADPPDQPNRLGERAVDQDRRHADRKGPAQVLQRLRQASLDRPVGHGEPAGLGPAPVVPGHHGLVDHAGGVRGELAACGGDLT